MTTAVQWVEQIFSAVPLPVLETWGRVSYTAGLFILICAYGGITFKPAGLWGIGREKQTWNARALLSIPLTFVAVFLSGYAGSFLVLVPGAQTFESLKDLTVFLCVVLFGFPALVAVPFAYGLSDLMEGVPPGFILDWWVGYFINPACFWIAYKLIGKNPDFKRLNIWARYLLFVFLFLLIEPALWGYICSGKFTPEISYRSITPALFFTTSVTWILAPVAMLGALPLARRFAMFWAEIPEHIRIKRLWPRDFTGRPDTSADMPVDRVPIRMVLAAPILTFVLSALVLISALALTSGEKGAYVLAGRLNEEIAANIQLQLDNHSERDPLEIPRIQAILQNTNIHRNGFAMIVDRAGRPVATSRSADTLPAYSEAAVRNLEAIVLRNALAGIEKAAPLRSFNNPLVMQFDVITAEPMSRQTWLTRAVPYTRTSPPADWIILVSIPEAYYLEGVAAGRSQSAVVFSVALVLAVLMAAAIANLITVPIRRLLKGTRAVAAGELSERVRPSRLDELGSLAEGFNHMAARLEDASKQTEHEINERLKTEKELQAKNQELERFTYTASHDLKSPLVTIQVFAGEIKQHLKSEQYSKIPADLTRVSSAAAKMMMLLDDLLQLSRVGKVTHGRLPVDMKGAIDDALVRTGGPLMQKSVKVTVDTHIPPASGDRRRIVEIFQNLIENAVKYMGNAQEPAVRIGAEQRAEGCVYYVADNGCGIALENHELIFGLFNQLDAGSEGTGIGLALVRRIVEAHEGRVWVESAGAGHGSKFCFTLAADQP